MKTFRYVAIAVLAVVGAWVIFTLFGILASNKTDDADRADLRAQVASQAAANKILEKQIKDLGETPNVTVPSPSEGSSTPVYIPVGATSQQVAATVQQFIDGAVARSCGGSCKGEPAEPAKNGKDGVSPPPAKDGVNGTNGEDGTDGKDGADGKPGRGIVSGPTCQDDGTWKTTYDQEPFEEIHPGPCKVTLLP